MYSEANMPTLSHFFCKWWIILINENYKSAIELNYWTLNHSVTNSVFQWHFLDLKKTSFPHLKNIVCFGRDVSKCAFERKFTTQPQIIPSKTQSAIFKNGSIFTIEYLKPLSCQTLYFTCLVQLKKESWRNGTLPSIFWKNIFTHLNLSVCIKREVIIPEKREGEAALTHVTGMHRTWPLIQLGSDLGRITGNLLAGINYLNDISTHVKHKEKTLWDFTL